MAYLEPVDYSHYGLPDSTTADWITAATALVNSYCRRPDLNVTQYTERLRVVSGTRAVQLSYLPLASQGSTRSPFVSIEGRYPPGWEMLVSATSVQTQIAALDVPSVQALFSMALAVTVGGQDYLIESVASNEAFGQVYLYRLSLREARPQSL